MEEILRRDEGTPDGGKEGDGLKDSLRDLSHLVFDRATHP